MVRARAKVAMYNMAILLLVALPAKLLIAAAQDLGHGPNSFGKYLEYGAFYYLVDIGPFLLGGLLHQLLWFFLSRTPLGLGARILAYLASPVIPIMSFLLWQADLRTAIRAFALPIAIAMALYVILLKPFPSGDAGRAGA